jgi:acetoin:2,6-dichlorophenolindophenol oxidoreductase subunit beta
MSTVTAAAPQTMSFTDAYRMALDEALESDPSVLLLGEDIGDKEGGGVFKVTKGLSTKYGAHRVRTTPISEQAILGAAWARRSPACGRSPARPDSTRTCSRRGSHTSPA